MSLVEMIPIERLRTTLAPLRGERTDPSELAPMPLRVAALDDGSFEVLDGFKRLATWRHDHREVPAVLEHVHGPAMKARLLDANTPRKTASPMDEARVVTALAGEDNLSVAAIAKRLGRKPAWVERRLTLGRRLAPDLSSHVDRGRLSLTLAGALSAFAAGDQLRLAAAIERHSLTTRETEALRRAYVLQAPRHPRRAPRRRVASNPCLGRRGFPPGGRGFPSNPAPQPLPPTGHIVFRAAIHARPAQIPTSARTDRLASG